MVGLRLENAWVEFPISRSARRSHGNRTGGAIDFTRGVVTALREISFELHEGDRLGLMGHNGAGKTTMLRLLAGAYPPTRGRIISSGRISTLFHTTPGLNIDGTGRENLVTCGLHLGMTRRQIEAKMDEIIDFGELGDYIDLPVRIYSAGMVTRLGFSIATAVDPEILLIDEGLATGDTQFSHKAQAKMREFMTRSSILVIASHSEALLSTICNRGILLEHGCIVADGPAKSLFETYSKAVIEAAQANDSGALQRAYKLATDLAQSGEKLPIQLEEQGLRYALEVAPNDAPMWQRYVDLLVAQGKALSPEVETRWLLAVLGRDPYRADLAYRLSDILAASAEELPEAVRARAIQLVTEIGNALRAGQDAADC